MNKVTFYFIVSIATLFLFSCDKNDPAAEITPPRDYKVQYDTDLKDIEEYLNTYYITVVNNPGKPDDQDVTMTKIPDGGTQPSIMSYKDATTYPKLLFRTVKLHDVDYKLYYLVLRPGIGESPCNVDGVFTSYRGDYLSRDATSKALSTTKFEENKFPQTFFQFYPSDGTLPKGWSEILPKFKTGSYIKNGDGTVSYNDFGSGVMFIPSGYGYYDKGYIGIPAYAPLMYSFKLYEIQRLDQDSDGVPSFQEDQLDKDRYLYDYRNTINYPTPPEEKIRYADDTDKDGIPDYLDSDDDGDNYTTKLEIKNPLTGLPYLYENIPSCDGNTTNPTRIKNYLDKNCH